MKTEALSDATWVAGLLAVWGPELGGALVAEGAAEDFAFAYAAAVSSTMPLRIVPSSITADALSGSIDLATTLAFGKPMYAKGLLDTHPRLLVRRAERLDTACTSLMANALDRQSLLLLAVVNPNDPDAVLAPKLEARLPFRIESSTLPVWSEANIAKARDEIVNIKIDTKWIADLCGVAVSIGIESPRAVLQAVLTARGIAALKGLRVVDETCVTLAARLVLAHRAQYVPQPDQEQDQTEPQPPPPASDAGATDDAPSKPADAEVILEAIKAAMPADLLAFAAQGLGKKGAGRNVKSNAPRKLSGQRGRRIGNKRASSLAGQRLDILATLRNAAPWQPLRRKLGGGDRMVVTRDDFRVSRIKQRNEATAIFAVDASGSTAFQRLAEAKGAVESILAECYVRRDRVALVAFRSKKAELLLPPTRSLERAKRALAGLPGGGGTPLASGLDEAFALAVNVRRAGGNPIVIFLTDGRGNVTRDGEGNKVKALEESQSAARLFAAEGFNTMLIDVSPEPQKSARNLAATMQATYLPMPRASATDIARPIRMALHSASQ